MGDVKEKLKVLIVQALKQGFEKGDLNRVPVPPVELEVPKISTHGDFSTNIAMVMAASQQRPPREVAKTILNSINDTDHLLARTEIAGPGFINFFISNEYWHKILKQIHEADYTYGASDIGKGVKVQVEFVSANPTGPLHIGHGRGAAVGDTLRNILRASGYEVEKEYYINDSGRQIRTLGLSVFLRYQELHGASIDFPTDYYQGDYIRETAQAIAEKEGQRLLEIPEDQAVDFCAKIASSNILDGIKEDLIDFGVTFDHWFSEQSLFDSGAVEEALQNFKDQGTIYEKDGALWFRTTAFGDEKDRVVVRANGITTYFASDIAYHQDKLQREFDKIIDIWGADHHGYIPRISACVEAMGYEKEKLKVILIQLVNLLRGGKPVAMSTRAGEFVALRAVIDEVGRDAARFIFLTRRYDSPLDFDLDLAKRQSNDNPVYYVQYVHARISSILRKALADGISLPSSGDSVDLTQLTEPEELALIKCMAHFPTVVAESAKLMEPHRIPFYLTELASTFHSYYNKHRVLTDERALTLARLYMVSAVRTIVRNGLNMMGVSAPESM
jgi:arginyl-tRNA synthetase